jgi:hypothetical protein
VAAEAGRPDRTTQRMLVAVIVVALDFLEPIERGRVARDGVDHGVDAVAQLVHVELAAVFQILHNLLDATLQHIVRNRGMRHLGFEIGLDLPLGLAQIDELVAAVRCLHQVGAAQFDEARIGGSP